jgi:hypothetical protein
VGSQSLGHIVFQMIFPKLLLELHIYEVQRSPSTSLSSYSSFSLQVVGSCLNFVQLRTLCLYRDHKVGCFVSTVVFQVEVILISYSVCVQRVIRRYVLAELHKFHTEVSLDQLRVFTAVFIKSDS